MISKECYLRKLEITRGFNAPCIVLIIGKVLIKESKKKKTRFYDLPGSVRVLSTSKQNRETENVVKAEEYRLGSKVRKAKEKAA